MCGNRIHFFDPSDRQFFLWKQKKFVVFVRWFYVWKTVRIYDDASNSTGEKTVKFYWYLKNFCSKFVIMFVKLTIKECKVTKPLFLQLNSTTSFSQCRKLCKIEKKIFRFRILVLNFGCFNTHMKKLTFYIHKTSIK